jgi:hypothetical protein
MRTLFLFLLFGALALLWLDDNSKRSQVADALDHAAKAELQSQSDSQQIQALTAQLTQLEYQVSQYHPVRLMPTPVPTPTPPPPQWFQQQLNGAKSLLDAPNK